MRIFVTGATGMIGRRLVDRLIERGDEPVLLSRRADEVRRDPRLRGVRVVPGDPAEPGAWQAEVDGVDAVVALAGQSLFSGRWDGRLKRQIRDSRVYGVERAVEAIARARRPPGVLVAGSAIGYYGHHGDEELTEASQPGSDFLATVCRELEDAARGAEASGLRVALVRTGVALARGEGALKMMGPLFRWGLGSPVGNGGSLFRPARGEQWLSWIHVDDIVGLFLLAIDHPNAAGPINGTSPAPARNVDFSRLLAKTLRRPFLPVGPPDLLLELLIGEAARAATTGQRVVPARALALGYRFAHPRLSDALAAVYGKRPRGEWDPEVVAAAAGNPGST